MVKKKKTKRKIASGQWSRRPSAFKSLALHVTEAEGRKTFDALHTERHAHAAFSLAAAQPELLDPESAAKRILAQALASDAAPGLVAPKVGKIESEFRSLGVETVPLTGTNVVKFRQFVSGVPVYGSLVSVELGEDNEMVSVNSNIAQPDVKSAVAKISPADALRKAADGAGYGREMPQATPVLNYYLDPGGKWHLAYIVENVRSRSGDGAKKKAGSVPLVFDYVIDAVSGALVAKLPRTPSGSATEEATDELGQKKTITIEVDGKKKKLRDPDLNLETYDFRFKDPQADGEKLPGAIVLAPPKWSSAAVSAHSNAAAVARFLRETLKRNNIDNKGGAMISTVNCVVIDASPGNNVWLNAFWDPDHKQMVYGQATFDGKLRSLASSLDVVAHELFHGVTDHTSRLEYASETGALNESYSDIFGTIVSNFAEPDIGKWNWLIGDGLTSDLDALRDMQDPTRHSQPKHMKDFVQTAGDHGGVHTNSGIHNFAAFKIMSAKQPSDFLFKASELGAMFYVALTQHLSRQSTFADSRRGVTLATRSLFRALPAAELNARVAAVEAGFDAAGIK